MDQCLGLKLKINASSDEHHRVSHAESTAKGTRIRLTLVFKMHRSRHVRRLIFADRFHTFTFTHYNHQHEEDGL